MGCPLLIGSWKGRVAAWFWLSTGFVLVRYERQELHYKKIGAKDRDETHEAVP